MGSLTKAPCALTTSVSPSSCNIIALIFLQVTMTGMRQAIRRLRRRRRLESSLALILILSSLMGRPRGGKSIYGDCTPMSGVLPYQKPVPSTGCSLNGGSQLAGSYTQGIGSHFLLSSGAQRMSRTTTAQHFDLRRQSRTRHPRRSRSERQAQGRPVSIPLGLWDRNA